jgi:general secretion pathway protein D
MEHCSLKNYGHLTCRLSRQSGVQVPVHCGVVSLTPGSALRRSQPRPASGCLGAVARFAFTLLAVLAVLILSSAPLRAESANSYYKHGQRAEALHDYDTAYMDYKEANKKNPTDLRFQVAIDRVRLTDAATHIAKGRKLLQVGNIQGALVEFLHAADIDPADETAEQEIAKIRKMQGVPPPRQGPVVPEAPGEQAELNSIGGPVQLETLPDEPLSLHMTEDSKVIYQAIGKAAGINVLFDPDYRSKRIQVDLNNVSLLDALRIVAEISSTFWRPVTRNTIFVAEDTRVKRMQLEEQAVQTFYPANVSQQNDLNDIQTALRNVLPNARVYGVASQNAIVVRGTPDELLLAQELINDLDKPVPEVVIDVAVLEVSKTWERTLGIEWPTNVGVSLQAPNSTSSASTTSSTTGTTTVSPTLYNLAHLKASDFAVSIGSAQLNLLLTNTTTQILADPTIRALNGQKATLTIGQKIPIATGSYATPGVSAAAYIGYAETQFQYIDVGIKLEVTPTIHYNGDVTLKMHLEDSAENGNVTIEGVTEPIIANRLADQVITLADGQASVLGGIVDNQNTVDWTGIPGLSSIPILKYLFGSFDHQINDDDLVFVVVPHVVSSQVLDPRNLRAIDTGEGQSIDLRFVQHAPVVVRPVAMQQPAPQAEPALGTVPGSSASSAASSALMQMRATAQSGQITPPAAAQPAATSPVQPNAAPAAQQPHVAAPQAQSAPAQAQPQVQAAPAAQQPRANLQQARPAPPQAQPSTPQEQAAQPVLPPAPPQTQGLSFAFNVPPGPLAAGATFQVPIVLKGGTDIASVPLQLRYNPAALTLVNVSAGKFLNRDGQTVALIHRDDGPGNVTIVAARPPGAAGISGTGTLCVLTFRAKAPGVSALVMTHAGAIDAKEKSLPAQAPQANITVK